MTKCEFVLRQGKKKGKKCKRYGTKKIDGKWLCFRHRGGDQTEAKEKFIEELTNKKPKEKADRPKSKFSVFKITLNTNKDFRKLGEEEKAKFKKIAKYIFSEHIKKYLVG